MFNFLATKTFTQSAITLIGTVLNGILGLLFYIMTARFLGPADFGILVLSITALTLLSDLANLGTNTGIIRFVGKYINSDKEKVNRFLKLTFEFKLIVWLVILVLGLFLAPFIASSIFFKEELTTPLRITLVGVGGAMFYSFVTNSIQAHQKFLTWGILNVGTNLLRLLIVALLINIYGLNTQNTLYTYIIILFLGFFVGLIFLPNFFKVKNELSVSKEFFDYNKWIALFIIIAAISSRMDTFLTGRFLSSTQVGIYGAANQLSQVVLQLTYALASVAAPKLASFNNDKVASLYLKKLQLLVCGLFLLGILSIPAISFLIPLVYGENYNQAVAPFVIIFIGQLFFLLAVPAHQSIFYYFSNPKIFVFTELMKLLITVTLGLLLIPTLGTIGAAFLVLITNIFSFAITGIWVIHKFSKQR